MFRHLFFLIALVLVPFPTIAETVTCPWKRADVSIDAGPIQHIPLDKTVLVQRGGVEPDMGIDDDAEQTPHYEWNVLNLFPDTTPAIVHCEKNEHPSKSVDITVPTNISRCIYIKEHGPLICRSGTVSFPGDLARVQILATGADGAAREISPQEMTKNKHKIYYWDHLDTAKLGEKLSATCFYLSPPYYAQSQDMNIPADMKACSLIDHRFRCTATPDEHDLFWP